MAFNNDSIEIVIFVISVIAILFNFISIVLKLCKDFTNPKLWKYALLYQDFASLCLSLGLLLSCINIFLEARCLCDVSGVCLLFGISQSLLSYLTTGIILLCIQNPGKSTSISNFHRNIFIAVVLPEILVCAALACLPYVSNTFCSTGVELDGGCFPLQEEQSRTWFGILLTVFWWIVLFSFAISDVILVLKLWKFNNRINSAQNNVWQTKLVIQGKLFAKVSVFEHILCLTVLVATTVSIYTCCGFFENNRAWLVVLALAIWTVVHGVLSNIGNMMWTTCCCQVNKIAKEPHRKLKKLELLKVEAPGKLHMKATWTVGKNATKRGLMKVYGPKHLKSWAQEIVMLGMLRRIQHPSLLQCLWTNSSNPYYETMTLISGEIVTSDSRIICLELTNGGTLSDFLHKAELPLPEQCQRMIVHDIAEGLFYLHHENILHSTLTTSCIYLKGSLQSMVLRAAVGDFEQAQIYGILQQNLDSSFKDKRYFFLPDIRSFALITLEIVAKMCEKKFQNRYVNYSADHLPLALNLSNVISDDDDEIEAQYGLGLEDTHRMFHAIHNEPCEKAEVSDCEDQRISDESFTNLTDSNRPPLTNKKDRNTMCFTESNDNYRHDNSVHFSQLTDVKSHNRIKKEFENKTEMSKGSDSLGSEKIISRDHRVQNSLSACSKARNEQQENSRCASPDPMKDEIIQELRKETESGLKSAKTNKKFPSPRKRTDDEFFKNPKMEAFAKVAVEQSNKRKDSHWLSKPSSILKSITSNDTTVSVFKAKPNDEEPHLDAIEEEDINPGQSSNSSVRQVKVREVKPAKAEVWDIIDEQYYTQVNRKAMLNLKKTVSGESRSSLWSFISTPEDMDDEDLDDILECLPGMAEPSNHRKAEFTVSDIIEQRESAARQEQTKKLFSLTNLSKSKFELIDYYEMLKSKQITINDVPEDKRELLLNVVELKAEEKRRRQCSANGSAILSDEMYDVSMNPGAVNNNKNVKVISFRSSQCHSSPHKQMQTQKQEKDPRLERARSAPLKRPRTPMHKPVQEKAPEVNPAFQSTKSVIKNKRNKARVALRKAINRDKQQFGRVIAERRKQGDYGHVNYASMNQINMSNSMTCEREEKPVVTVPIPSSESFSVTNIKPALKDVKRYPSFSSNESASSIGSSVRTRPADVSLTSGELSSLSSQAESDHYETDCHMTDAETTNSALVDRNKTKTPSSRVDSGFDSGSVSSELSDAFNNKIPHSLQPFPGSKAGLTSWTRNYKPIDSTPDSAFRCTHDFLPSVKIVEENNSKVSSFEHKTRACCPEKDTFTGLSAATQEPFSKTENNRVLKTPTPRLQSPPTSAQFYTNSESEIQSYGAMTADYNIMQSNECHVRLRNARMSPDRRPMSPVNQGWSKSRSAMSPNKPAQTDVTGLSPLNRPMSPNVQPTENRRASKQKTFKQNHTSSQTRDFIPVDQRQLPDSMPFSPGRKLTRPLSPPTRETIVEKEVTHDTATETSAVKASKRYRSLVKQGVPLRTSSIDSSPVRHDDTSSVRHDGLSSRPESLENIFQNDQLLFENLDANGFFRNRPISRSPSPVKSPVRERSPVGNHSKQRKEGVRSSIPLDEIIRESPESRSNRKAHRSASSNHLAVSDDTYLNQPTSEDSETCSIKTNKSNTSMRSGSKFKTMVDAELVIDRIFSKKETEEDQELDVEIEAALGLDKDPFKAINEMYLNTESSESSSLDDIPLLNGVNQHHVHGCLQIVSSLHVVNVHDLLPAEQKSFDILEKKLRKVGQLGNVGNQLLDVIRKCWLQEMPPSSGDLVEQLTDPVTETEL